MPATQTRLEYDVVDVFTDRAFAGNPLAVVYGAEGLATDQLRAIANEFNLSETTFPLTPTAEDAAAGADYRLRIFTPWEEIPFAGHPTIGTAWALHQRGRVEPGQRVQACDAGLIGVEIPATADEPVELSAVPRDQARALPADALDSIVELVGLERTDAVGPAYFAGTGLTWVYLQVSAEAVSRARASSRRLAETPVDQSGLLDPVDGVDVFAVAADEGDGPLRVSSRVFIPGFSIPEDPATGSAAAGLGLVLVACGLAAADGETAYEITQGVELRRPSLLRGRVEAENGAAVRVRVAGQVVPVSQGSIRVP